MRAADFIRESLLAHWKTFSEAGGTQVRLAERAGVLQGQISLWLKALRAGDIPRMDGIESLAKGFDVPLVSLFPPAHENGSLRAMESAPSSLSPYQLRAIEILGRFSPAHQKLLVSQLEVAAHEIRSVDAVKKRS